MASTSARPTVCWPGRPRRPLRRCNWIHLPTPGATPAPIIGWQAKRLGSARLEAVKRLFATDDTVMIGSEQLKVEEAAAIFFRHIQSKAAEAGFASRLDQA